MDATIFNIQHFSINDGPGIRTVVFFKGCPLNCSWCHNPESKSTKPVLSFLQKNCTLCGKCAKICPNGVHTFNNNKHILNREKCVLCAKCTDACVMSELKVIGKKVSCDEIMLDIAKDDVFFGTDGGVTISGGEPFLQFDEMIDLLKKCKKKGYNTAVETCGYTSKEHIIESAKYIDTFLYDYKLFDSEKHKKYTGVDNKIITDNLFVLDDLNANLVLRCPIIPDINNCEQHFHKLAEIINAHKCIKSANIMLYHPLGILKGEQIGAKIEYLNKDFLSAETAEKYLSIIKSKTNKPVKIG